MPVFHYGAQREMPLDIGLLDDAARYPAEPDARVPTLIFAGRHDDAVPLTAVEHFVRARPERDLLVLDSGHELTDVLEPMWERTVVFLRTLGVIRKAPRAMLERLDTLDLEAVPNLAPDNHLQLPRARERLRALA
jgi:hypothetical protein